MPNPDTLGLTIRRELLQRTGPLLGWGSIKKDLGEVGQPRPKRWQRQTSGVLDLRDPVRREKSLRAMLVDEVWGHRPVYGGAPGRDENQNCMGFGQR